MRRFDLSVSVYDYAKKLAMNRASQKEKYSSSNPMSPNYELVGLLGEFIYGAITGEVADLRLRADGDDGIDFSRKRVQVKSSEEHKARHLIEYKEKVLDFDYYVFVIINLERLDGFIRGWISTEDFIKKRRVINFGYGDRWAIDLDEMNPWGKESNKRQ